MRGLRRGGAGLKAWAQAGLLLSGHTLSHVALSPGARSSRGLGRLPETNLLWKELGTGIGQRSYLPADFCTWRDVWWGAGGYASPALNYVRCLHDPGQEDDWAECPAGLGVGTTVALLPLLPASPCRAGMWGWLSSPPEACLQRPSVRCPLQQAASLESLMGTSLLSTALGSGGLGWRRGGCTPRVA